MAELKTRPGGESVTKFINSIADESRRQDCAKLLEIMKQATGAEPRMWGSSIVGFGDYHYKYASGREGDWFLAGFSPRKQNLTVYVVAGLHDYGSMLRTIGKVKTGRGCLYFNSLGDLHLPTLKKMIRQSVKDVKARARA